MENTPFHLFPTFLLHYCMQSGSIYCLILCVYIHLFPDIHTRSPNARKVLGAREQWCNNPDAICCNATVRRRSSDAYRIQISIIMATVGVGTAGEGGEQQVGEPSLLKYYELPMRCEDEARLCHASGLGERDSAGGGGREGPEVTAWVSWTRGDKLCRTCSMLRAIQ